MHVDRDTLITENRGLVRAAAHKVAAGLATRAPLDDLVEYGMIGLVEAADRYDPSRGVPFSSFAWPRIRGAVVDGLRTLRGLSRTELNRLRFERAAAARLIEAASEPQVPGRSLEQDFEETANVLADITVTYMVSTEDEDLELADNAPTSEARVADRELSGQLRMALDRLEERERSLLRMHYFGEMTIAQAGRELGISRAWALRIHNRAIGHLREQLGGSA